MSHKNKQLVINSNNIIRKNKQTEKLIDNISIIDSKQQTKDWRKNQNWYKGGKSNECELFQRSQIELITNIKCIKTDLRININTMLLDRKSKPMTYPDGFEWTENFDGFFRHNNCKYLIDFKFVCDSGGAQTRSLREVYHFITYQLENLLSKPKKDTYFINILDGNESYKTLDKFNYLTNKKKYNNVKKFIFIGDMYSFNKYWIHKTTSD
jgi:hypothetical protein